MKISRETGAPGSRGDKLPRRRVARAMECRASHHIARPDKLMGSHQERDYGEEVEGQGQAGLLMPRHNALLIAAIASIPYMLTIEHQDMRSVSVELPSAVACQAAMRRMVETSQEFSSASCAPARANK